MRFHKSYFDELILSQSNVLFTFGNVGSGKTCFFGHLLNYINNTYLLEYNRKSNLEGYRHCDIITKNMRKKQLPDRTLSGELKNVDFKLTYELSEGELEKTYFTYVDMPGDDLRYVNPTAEDITGEVAGGVLPEHIEQFFQFEGINITILGVIDYNDAESQFNLFHQFLNHITAQYDFKINKCLIIITKWDQSKGNESVKSFIEQNGKQCLFWMKHKVDKWSAYPFSIGTVSKNNKQKLSELNYEYCSDVLSWLISTAGYNPDVVFDGEDILISSDKVDEENRRVVNAFKIAGSTILPYFSGVFAEISKMADSIRNIRGKKQSEKSEEHE